MIHQFIFANPKPGMTAEDFQNYWVNIHAVKYASKIMEIKKYMINTSVPFGGKEPLYQGIAEIWLNNEKEQLESLQSAAFLQGARLDEPNWAAFWMTLVLDTTSHILMEGPGEKKGATWVKETIIVKRKPGMPLEEFRIKLLENHGPMILELPGLRRCLVGIVNDGYYSIGESSFDAVIQLWFDDIKAVEEAHNSIFFTKKVKPDALNICDPKHMFMIFGKEHWIIGPEPR